MITGSVPSGEGRIRLMVKGRQGREQEIEAVVLGINREEQKISLGVRQLETNPWDKALEKYPPGTKVKGKKARIIRVTDQKIIDKVNEICRLYPEGPIFRSQSGRAWPCLPPRLRN